jgi:predicted PurR-regulated permease PerM
MPQGRTKKQIFLLFFMALFLLVARLFYPFMTIILWSGLIYAFLEPLFEKLTKNIHPVSRSRRSTALSKSFLAGVFSVAGVLVFAVPFMLLFISLLRQVLDLLGSFVRLIEENPDIFTLSHTSPIGGFIYKLSGGSVDLSRIDVVREMKLFMSSSSARIIGFSGTILKNTLTLAITLAFMVFTLFFLLVDGKQIISILVSAIPIENSYTTMFMKKMRESGRQLIVGFFLVAIYQATAMFVLAVLFKIKSPLVLATLTAVASFVPMVGTSLVWAPLSLIIALSGNIPKAILFFVLAAFFVSFVDNFMKPIVLGERLRIHPLLIFFAIVGGLNLFGFNGLILGPLIVIIFFSAVELYEQIDQVRGTTASNEEDNSV